MKTNVKILIVEDSENKRDEVKRQVSFYAKAIALEFKEAGNYEKARRSLENERFDFVIMDLKIPAGNEDPHAKWSRVLVEEIADGSLCYPMHVFGLTAHEELIESERDIFTRRMFGLFVFDWADQGWARDIAAKIEYLSKAIENGASYRLNAFDYDLLILTARKSEFGPVRQVLFQDRATDSHPLIDDSGSHFGPVSIPGKTRPLKTGLLCVGKTGLAPTAAATIQAIQLLRPKVVAMLGMCAGFRAKGIRLLDTIVARESACWQDGKSFGDNENDKFDPRSQLLRWSENIGSHVERRLEMDSDEFALFGEEIAASAEYLQLKSRMAKTLSKEPKVVSGLVVSGSAVVASDSVRKQVESMYTTAIGLEMEIFSVYTAAKMAIGAPPEVIAVKSVADLADGAKSDAAQPLASEISAKVFLKLLAKYKI